MTKMIHQIIALSIFLLISSTGTAQDVVRGVVTGKVEYKETSLLPDGTCFAELEDGRELEVKFDKGHYSIPIPADYKGESLQLRIVCLGEKKSRTVYLNQLGTTEVELIKMKCAALPFITIGCPSF